MSGQEYEVVAQSQPLEGLANRVEIRARRTAVLLQAEDYTHLFGGIGRTCRRDIGRGFHDVLYDCLTGFIFELGHRGRAQRRRATAGHRQNSGQITGRSFHRSHGVSLLYRPGTGEYSGWTDRNLAQRWTSS